MKTSKRAKKRNTKRMKDGIARFLREKPDSKVLTDLEDLLDAYAKNYDQLLENKKDEFHIFVVNQIVVSLKVLYSENKTMREYGTKYYTKQFYEKIGVEIG